MSIGEYGAGSAGNFNHPFTAYMLADFAHEFGISLPRLQLLMRQMIKSVRESIQQAKNEAMMHQLSESEIKHIDVCIQIINEAIEELGQEVKHIPEMVS